MRDDYRPDWVEDEDDCSWEDSQDAGMRESLAELTTSLEALAECLLKFHTAFVETCLKLEEGFRSNKELIEAVGKLMALIPNPG